jgi:hypothetical protein
MGFFGKLKRGFHSATHAIGHTASKVVHSKPIRSVAHSVKKAAVTVVHSKPVNRLLHNKATRWVASHTKADDLIKKAATSTAKFVRHGVEHPIELLKQMPALQLFNQLRHVGAAKTQQHKLPAKTQALPAEDNQLLLMAGGVGLLGLMVLSRR